MSLDPFCPRVDVVPDYRLIIGGIIIQIGLSVYGQDFGHYWSRYSVTKSNQLHVDIFRVILLN